MKFSSKVGRFIGGSPPLVGSLFLAARAVSPADAQSSTAIVATTLRLSPANIDYDLGVASLRQTMADPDLVVLAKRHRGACMAKRLEPNTSEFALCVVDAMQVAAN